MTAQDGIELLRTGGVVACLVIALWAMVTRRIVSRGEFDRLDTKYQELEKDNKAANDELRKQSSTNARLVELAFSQRAEAEDIRRTGKERVDAST